MRQIAKIKAIEYIFPENISSNVDLAAEFSEWSAEKILEKTGIKSRFIAGKDDCASDLAVLAAVKLLKTQVIDASEIDYLIFCTQSPDYFLPATACIIQDRLGLPRSCGAVDINQGCSGFVYGLGLAKGLIESGQARNVLLLTAETYSKFVHPKDKSVRSIFGDAACATLVQGLLSNTDSIHSFVYGTDGSGAENLIVPVGGMRNPKGFSTNAEIVDTNGNVRTKENLFMDGPEIFAFTMRVIPETVEQITKKSNLTTDSFDIYIFHQANKYMLDHLRRRLGISDTKFYINFEDCGNTVSSTIPIAMKRALDDGSLKTGKKLMILGFGVGYSWAGAIIDW